MKNTKYKYRIVARRALGGCWQVQYKKFLFWWDVYVPTECWFISYLAKARYLNKCDAEEAMAYFEKNGHKE